MKKIKKKFNLKEWIVINRKELTNLLIAVVLGGIVLYVSMFLFIALELIYFLLFSKKK